MLLMLQKGVNTGMELSGYRERLLTGSDPSVHEDLTDLACVTYVLSLLPICWVCMFV